MAWIAKDSAHAQIDRREQPYLTDALKQRIELDLVPRYATRRAVLLPTLHMVQHEYGWIPAQALEEIGEFLGIAAAEVLDTASFYEEFHLKPKGRHLVQVCRSITCELCGYNDLSKKLQQKLNITPGQTTDDDRITFMELECLGACDLAPVAMVDETLHGNLTWEKLETIIDELT